ncbi:MAG: DUF4097 family beta strand repeat protein [Clostridia bacterium]|nr:DUF4097 family beta strand repeat protein [Clostridia bacterium]
MRKKTILWLSVGTALVLLGCAVFFGALAAAGFDFSRFSTVKYEKTTHEIAESYSNISVLADTADVLFVQTEGEITKIECYEQENVKHKASVKDGTLVVEVSDTRAWYEHIGIGFGNQLKITVFLPKGAYGSLTVRADTSDVKIAKEILLESLDVSLSTGDVICQASPTASLKIKTTTGDVCVSGVATGTLEISTSTGEIEALGVTCTGDASIGVDTGEVELEQFSCKSLSTSGDTGDISLKGVIVSEQLSIIRSTGDVELNACDAAEIVIQTSTGDVEGRLLTDKTFVVKTNTGGTKIPQGTVGGKCEITTDTGDIQITIG